MKTTFRIEILGDGTQEEIMQSLQEVIRELENSTDAEFNYFSKWVGTSQLKVEITPQD
jgi:isocitrate/isopropylmalate dehydrogenase